MYHEKTDDQITTDFQLLCRLCHNDYGFNFQTLNKCNNILIIAMGNLELEPSIICPEDDTNSTFQWTQEQLNKLDMIKKEDEDLMKNSLPPLLS